MGICNVRTVTRAKAKKNRRARLGAWVVSLLLLSFFSSANTPNGTPELTGPQKKTLLEEYQRSVMTEWRALLHRQKTDLDGLKEAHRIRENEFERETRREKSEKFQTLQGGDERRAFLREQQEKRKNHREALKSEIHSMKTEHGAERKRLHESQQKRMRSFEEHLSRGERPPQALWSAYGDPKQGKHENPGQAQKESNPSAPASKSGPAASDS